jgi:hypothetical protein
MSGSAISVHKAVLHFSCNKRYNGNITQVNANPEPLTKLRRKDHSTNAEVKEVSDTVVTQTELHFEDAFCSKPQLPTAHEEYFQIELIIVLRNIIQYFQGRS